MPDEQQDGILGAIFGWLQHPFNAEGDVWNWAFFLLLIIIILAAWKWLIEMILGD